MERRLAAILAADMVGYSRLIEADEIGTLERQKVHRAELIDPAIDRHHGRIVKEMGDGYLVEFPSVVEAVQCALEIQRSLLEREADRPADLKIIYRIGINLGDVIIEDGDVFGGGVNVASRLEAIAPPGGICISGTAYDTIHSKQIFDFRSLGDIEVKNIKQPIRAYEVLLEPGTVGTIAPMPHLRARRRKWFGITIAVVLLLASGGGVGWWIDRPEFEPADPTKYAFEMPDKPSIAVLPFDNLSAEADQDYFTEGLTEDIITSLSTFPNLFVIARSSTSKFKDQTADIRNVAEDLGVRYILAGSVRRSGDTIRINTQLIDALSGRHIWAEKYDRDLVDIFELQDEITQEVTSRLASNIVEAEFLKYTRGGTRSVVAYDFFLRGWQAIQAVNPKSNDKAEQLFRKAIEADPGYARAHAGLALTGGNKVQFGWGGSDLDAEHAIELAKRAVELDPGDWFTRRIKAVLLRYQGDIDQAIEAYEQSLARGPSNPDTLMSLAFSHALAGHGADAVRYSISAMRLNPYPPPWYHSFQGISYYIDGQFDKAIASLRQFQSQNPRFFLSYFWLAMAYAQIGDLEKSHKEREQLYKLRPDITANAVLRSNHARGTARDMIYDGAVKAGITLGADEN